MKSELNQIKSNSLTERFLARRFGADQKDQDPLLPCLIPVSYRKCVVNQKKLSVSQIYRSVHHCGLD